MVVVAKGEKVMDGVIIDPWREPGKIYFSKVKEDNAQSEYKELIDKIYLPF